MHVLLKLARDKGFERLVKIEKGKNTERINMIRKRHQSSLTLPFSNVNTTDHPDTWEVDSTEEDKRYSVTVLHKSCPYNCYTRCIECDTCVHMYTCNCADALIKSSICKHIHLIARLRLHTLAISSNSHSPEPKLNEPNNDLNNSPTEKVGQHFLLSTLGNSTLLNCNVIRNEVKTALLSLAAHVENTDDSITLREVKSRIMSTINFIKAKQAMMTSFPNAGAQPATTHIAKQRPFFSTKKKRKVSLRIRKPNLVEKRDICEAMLETQSPLYGIQMKTISPLPRNTKGK